MGLDAYLVDDSLMAHPLVVWAADEGEAVRLYLSHAAHRYGTEAHGLVTALPLGRPWRPQLCVAHVEVRRKALGELGIRL